jgi:hypothetical protein
MHRVRKMKDVGWLDIGYKIHGQHQRRKLVHRSYRWYLRLTRLCCKAIPVCSALVMLLQFCRLSFFLSLLLHALRPRDLGLKDCDQVSYVAGELQAGKVTVWSQGLYSSSTFLFGLELYTQLMSTRDSVYIPFIALSKSVRAPFNV